MPVNGSYFPFTEEDLQSVPDSPGVYELEADGEVLYVGMAQDNLRTHLQAHLIGSYVVCAKVAKQARVEAHPSPATRLRELLRENLLSRGRLPKCNSGGPR